jgi:hypothetical protein
LPAALSHATAAAFTATAYSPGVVLRVGRKLGLSREIPHRNASRQG